MQDETTIEMFIKCRKLSKKIIVIKFCGLTGDGTLNTAVDCSYLGKLGSSV